jgi:hypothetical protein
MVEANTKMTAREKREAKLAQVLSDTVVAV